MHRKYLLPKLTWDDQRMGYSMSGEDGITEKILANIPPKDRTFVEIGINLNTDLLTAAKRVLQGNCVCLKETGWTGWWFDGQALPDMGVIGAFVTPLNVNSVLRENGVPAEVDVFSLDVDGQDFWIFMALDLRARIVILEANSHFDPDENMSAEYLPQRTWRGDRYFGASLGALNLLAKDKGYTLVYWNGANSFFVRTDLLQNSEDFVFDQLAYRYDFHKIAPPGDRWVNVVTGERITRDETESKPD